MNTALVRSENPYLLQLERSHFSSKEYTVETAHRLGLELAAIVCQKFPDLDQVLLARQIESDYLEWAYQNGTFISRLTRKAKGK